jgi:hemerythrin-like metal-binding protein
MSLMDWDEKKFDVLVPLMNTQHEKLIAIMNQLYDRADAKAPKIELNALLVELRDYTVKHFREEEALLQQMKFPQFTRHKSIHEKLLEDFGNHYQSFSQGKGELSPAFFEFLRLWLTSHIMHIDRKYGEYSKERNAA